MSANPVDDRSDMESLPAHRVPHEAPSSSPVESSAHHLPTLSDPTPPTIAMRPAESYVEDTLAPRSDAGEQEQTGLSQEKVGMAQSAPDTPNQLKDQQVLEEITKGVAGIKGFEDPSSIVTEPASQRGSAVDISDGILPLVPSEDHPAQTTPALGSTRPHTGPEASLPTTGSTALHTSVGPASEPEEEWLLKSIAWPPLPPRPASSASAQGFETSELRVKIIQQNRNGPCSLIALCNVLILRNDLHIPPGRDRVTYSYLSMLLADYFLRVTTPAPTSPALVETSESTFEPERNARQLSLEAALSILPETQHGLNLNPQFTRIDGFTSSAGSGNGELALFSLAQIPLLHGWIADPSDHETFEVLNEARDYDRAVEMMVEGSEVAGKLGLEGQGGVELDEDELLKEAERRSQWTFEEEEKVRKAHLIDRFLNATSTQLTYPGLFALSSTPALLPPSGLGALFRNSHLSVIYRRPRSPTPQLSPSQGPSGPELFTLVTDSSFAGEEQVVWESIEDVDGSASEFFTAGLSRSHARGGDFAGVRNLRDLPEDARGVAREDNEVADLALAQQLQAEEEQRAEAYERAEQRRFEEEEDARSRNARAPDTTSHTTRYRPEDAGSGRREYSAAGGRISSEEGRKSKSKAEKEKCLVM